MVGLARTGELVRLELPAQPAFVGVARSVVIAVASALDGFDDDRLEDLRVVVSEACTNAVEAHRRDAVDDVIVVCCVGFDDHLRVSIEDRAYGFGLGGAAALEGGHAPDAPARSWGMHLIEALVDDVTFRMTEFGTAVDLVVRFDRAAG